MTPSPSLIETRRQATSSMIDSGGSAGRLVLLDSYGGVVVNITLAYPCGAPDATGIALSTTEYAQSLVTADAASGRLENSNGVLVGTVTVGLADDTPTPEMVLPARTIYAGAFFRLNGAHIACG